MALASLPPLIRRARPQACATLLVTLGCGFAACAETTNPAQTPPEQAQPEKAGDAANGRFVMTPVAEGFLRLDTRSGQVSLCTLNAGQAQCRASADERAALEAEIDRLARENAAFKGQAPKSAQNADAAQGAKPAPDEEERRFDRALDRAERFLRRMMQIFRDSSGDKRPAAPL
ncbi:hypothetical protein [uncultured Rhodoblastus sp.]|uniref:hypothetical protein n=1 Tax=uncultured Rhodoblastus sp. TaxID=543037 RepID=UPI0025F0DC59|nr:hypothetical protein [uncultured Rhodoblastus sp.]